MAQPLSRKEETHQRIVSTAARAMRRNGYAGIGVADVMKEAGLTHGGFYAHFNSRTALLAEAADQAGAEGVEQLRKVAAAAPPREALTALIDAYLSQQHVQGVETGCPVAALGSEMPRQEPEVRAAATRRIKELVDLIERQMPDWGTPENHDKALGILSTLVGTLVLARAVDDARLSRSVQRAGRKFLRQKLSD
jgi:AcrR family transcriptional regulator